MLLKKLIPYAKLRPLLNACEDISVNKAVSSSGEVTRGDIFFAVEGLSRDGNDYVDEAVRRGAAAVVTSRGRGRELEKFGICILEAENVRASLSYALDAIYGNLSGSMKYIAVTGTNGKTTTSHMLYRIMRLCGSSCGIIGTCGAFVNGEELKFGRPCSAMTTPDPEELYRILYEMKKRGADYVIIEASSHASAMKRLAPLRFEAAIFTNLSPEHLDFHKDMEDYFAAKRDIIRLSSLAVINADDPFGRRLIDEELCEKTVSASMTDPSCAYYASSVRFHGNEGISFVLSGEEKGIGLYIPVTGDFNVCNAMLAASTARALGYPRSCISAALSGFNGVCGRMQRVFCDGLKASVFIDYAHTPDALERVLRAAKRICGEEGKLTVLFGCGGDRDKSKRPKMGAIAASIADFVIITSDNPRNEAPDSIISDIIGGISEEYKSYTVITDRREAIRYAIGSVGPKDVLILAGKGHEKYEIVKGEMLPFDEEALVRSAVTSNNDD